MTAKGGAAALAKRIRAGEFITAPGVYDLISARVADGMGFPSLYMTGYGVVASSLGLPDAGIATYSDMVGRAEQIVSRTETPLIADADTGYGGLLNVQYTVRGYEAAGVAAIQIEDQEFPKKCGHTPGRKVIPLDDMVDKIRVARDSRDASDFMIIARTDARGSYGLDEALRRGEAFVKAGADILFIESPENDKELAKIGRSFDVPLMANMVEGGKTPVKTPAELKALGFQVAIFPAAAFLAAGAVVQKVYQALRDSGSAKAAGVPLYDFKDFSVLMGFQEVWDFEKRWAK